MTAKEIYDVLEAVGQGKEIQEKDHLLWRTVYTNVTQKTILHHLSNGDELRVKPAPRKPLEIWVNEYPEKISDYNFPSKEKADSNALSSRIRCVHFREVVEE